MSCVCIKCVFHSSMRCCRCLFFFLVFERGVYTLQRCGEGSVLLTYFLHSNEGVNVSAAAAARGEKQEKKCDNILLSLISVEKKKHTREVLPQLMRASSLPLKPLPAV